MNTETIIFIHKMNTETIIFSPEVGVQPISLRNDFNIKVHILRSAKGKSSAFNSILVQFLIVQ